MTDKSVIAYSSVWPLARRAIIGISFPPIPWPMTPTAPERRVDDEDAEALVAAATATASDKISLTRRRIVGGTSKNG